MIFSKVGHERVSGAIIRQIERLILEGVLKPGDRLPPERELAETFDVSRPTLREALGSLEERGLLVARQGGGTFVGDVMRSVFGEPIVSLFASHEKATYDYIEFRAEVEAVVAGLAAERATPADREILTRVFDQMCKAHEDPDPENESRIDVEFHIAVTDASHNIVLIQTLRSIYNLLVHGVFYNRRALYAFGDARDRLLEQHGAIYKAIMAGDRDAAEAAARAHMTYVRDAAERSGVAGARQQTAERRLSQLEKDPKRKVTAKR